MQYICSKVEVEKERDTLQADMKVLKAAEEQLKKTLVKKERETVRSVQAASGEESCKTVALQKKSWSWRTVSLHWNSRWRYRELQIMLRRKCWRNIFVVPSKVKSQPAEKCRN